MKKPMKRFFTSTGIVNKEAIIKRINEFLQTHGVSNSNRIREIIKIVSDSDNSNVQDTLVHHELYEIGKIIIFLGEQYPELVVKAITTDGISETNRNKDSKGRNTQFELLVASIFLQAGFDIEFGEPDIYFHFRDQRYNIACKRPKSKRKVLYNIKSACNQIDQQNGIGIVLLDLTPTFSEKIAEYGSLQNMPGMSKKLIWDDFLCAHYKKIEKFSKEKVAAIHCFSSMNSRVQNSTVCHLFDYNIEIKKNRTEEDNLHYIINKIQSIDPSNFGPLV
ncbi:hypothetical protein [Sessilibacter corallicola]|uniref:hypothetical protein n=1 Tax=Sessilibacter corallicola TaxID=2904075 RepID=UPI001E2B76D0|nr:hypothetical protein [Sessilibacter corallicola]MCE2028047.1 hypothetical protein [Sessilibacter corallicola]